MLRRSKFARAYVCVCLSFARLSLAVTMCSSAPLSGSFSIVYQHNIQTKYSIRDGHETAESESSQDRVPFHFDVWVHLWYFDNVYTHAHRKSILSTDKNCVWTVVICWRCGCYFYIVDCVRTFIIVIVFVPPFFLPKRGRQGKAQLFGCYSCSIVLSFDALHNRSSIDQYIVCVSVAVYTRQHVDTHGTALFLRRFERVFMWSSYVSMCVCVIFGRVIITWRR